MQVAATHAALLLAQGAGRLIRTTTDRGVVAVLDPRLATARYGGFLKASLPPMWTTTDPAVVRKALGAPGRPARSEPAAAVVAAPGPADPEERRHRGRDVDGAGVRRGRLAARGTPRVPAADEERDRPGGRVAVVAGDRVAATGPAR